MQREDPQLLVILSSSGIFKEMISSLCTFPDHQKWQDWLPPQICRDRRTNAEVFAGNVDFFVAGKGQYNHQILGPSLTHSDPCRAENRARPGGQATDPASTLNRHVLSLGSVEGLEMKGKRKSTIGTVGVSILLKIIPKNLRGVGFQEWVGRRVWRIPQGTGVPGLHAGLRQWPQVCFHGMKHPPLNNNRTRPLGWRTTAHRLRPPTEHRVPHLAPSIRY